MTGTEILWPYLTQWHRHLGNFTFATIYLFYSRLYLRGLEGMISADMGEGDFTCQDPVEVQLVAANERQDVNDDFK